MLPRLEIRSFERRYMFFNSDFIAAELLLSIPVLEIVYGSMKDTDLTEEEMMFIIFLIAIAFSMLYTFYFGETNSSRDTTEAFTVSIIEGIVIAIITFFVNEICPSICGSGIFGRSGGNSCNSSGNCGCLCGEVAEPVNTNGNCGCTSQQVTRTDNCGSGVIYNSCNNGCNNCTNAYTRRNTCTSCNC